MTNTYTFEESTAPTFEFRETRKSRKGNGDDASLTYSASSSVAGESTDSSFGDIMKVLEQQGDSKALADFLRQHHFHRDEKSVAADSLAYSAKSNAADSLAYSTDAASLATGADSHLQGSSLISSGQQSDQSGYDGGNYGSALGSSYVNNGGGQRQDDDMLMMFSPAEHSDSMKLRKQRKRKERREKRQTIDVDPALRKATVESPNSPASLGRTPKAGNTAVTPPRDSPERESRQGTPPSARPPKSSAANSPERAEATTVQPGEEDDVWYGKWWMFCFSDMLGTINKR